VIGANRSVSIEAAALWRQMARNISH